MLKEIRERHKKDTNFFDLLNQSGIGDKFGEVAPELKKNLNQLIQDRAELLKLVDEMQSYLKIGYCDRCGKGCERGERCDIKKLLTED